MSANISSGRIDAQIKYDRECAANQRRRTALEFASRLGHVESGRLIKDAAIIESYLTKGTVPKAKK